MPSMGKAVIGICGFVAVCFTSGLIVGKARSPKYAEIGQVQDNLERRIRVSKAIVGKNPRLLGRLVAYDWDTLVTATFPAGRYDYVWQNLALPIRDTARCVAIDPNLKKCAVQGYSPGIARAGMDEKAWGALLVAAGLPTALKLKDVDPLIESKSGFVYVASAIGGAAGFYAGYRMAYKDEYDPDSEKFRAVLNDPRSWRDIVSNRLANAGSVPVSGISFRNP